MNDDVGARIRLINNSLRCFTYGLLGLLPVIGVPCAVAALWLSGRIRVEEKRHWNAARPYRIWGVVCAAFGTIFWFLVVVLIIFNGIANCDGGSGGGGGG